MLKWKEYYELMNVYMIIAGIFAERDMPRADKLQYVNWCLNELRDIKERTLYDQKLQIHLDGICGQLRAALEEENISLIRASLHPLYLILDMYEAKVVVA